MIRRTLIVLAASAALLLSTASACALQDPCAKLPTPTPQQRAVAVAPVEVEWEVNDSVDCQLVGDRWVRERD